MLTAEMEIWLWKKQNSALINAPRLIHLITIEPPPMEASTAIDHSEKVFSLDKAEMSVLFPPTKHV